MGRPETQPGGAKRRPPYDDPDGDGPDAPSSGSPTDGGDAEQELRAKKRVLAALVVHDLRSPLSAIQGYLQLLREELTETEEGEPAPSAALRYIDDATTLVGKALGLVATILDVDELEDGILHAQPAPLAIAELIERARAGNRAHFEVRQLDLEVSCDPAMVVRLDRDLFARVLENLLDNACRYAPRGGRCTVHVARDERGVEIAVGNNGPVVPPGEREKIFGRYFQVEARRAAARANRGLGLYFCKLAVEAHGGTIHVEQRGDLGAVFVVRIPE
ncbi:MAG: HAMP domain-containing histidine kinase [Deltaproteobacteria bacterium]|nr:HAMP domain-containing histidine kinase [Deltaproteobacteria bacterium]MCW5801870.1 HAMP domain-containing histidine kinase [Deltaproteobacteria bacterium]